MSGFNRYVRNPMYVSLILVIIGQVLLFGNFWLLAYAAVAWAVPAAFVRFYEEPTLAHLRRPVRAVPAVGARLVAPAAGVDTGPGRRRRRVPVNRP